MYKEDLPLNNLQGYLMPFSSIYAINSNQTK